jgi:hypothetical protein
MLRGLKLELEQGRDRLNEIQGKLVQRYNWDSATMSGRAMLLNSNDRSKLSQLYFALDNYNYEAKLQRQFSEQARQAASEAEAKVKSELARVRWSQLVEMQKNLVLSITNILKEDFWRTDC